MVDGVPPRLLLVTAGEVFWTQAGKRSGIVHYGVTLRGVLSLQLISLSISQASRRLRCLIDMKMANGTDSACNTAFARTMCRYLLRVYIEGGLDSAVFAFLAPAKIDRQQIRASRRFLHPSATAWVHILPDLSCLTALRHGSNTNGREKLKSYNVFVLLSRYLTNFQSPGEGESS